jgi:hypothetical protein
MFRRFRRQRDIRSRLLLVAHEMIRGGRNNCGSSHQSIKGGSFFNEAPLNKAALDACKVCCQEPAISVDVFPSC